MEQLASLQQRISDMINEKQGLTTLNAELQKKAVALIAKEKAMQGQTAAARTAAEVYLLCFWCCVFVMWYL